MGPDLGLRPRRPEFGSPHPPSLTVGVSLGTPFRQGHLTTRSHHRPRNGARSQFFGPVQRSWSSVLGGATQFDASPTLVFRWTLYSDRGVTSRSDLECGTPDVVLESSISFGRLVGAAQHDPVFVVSKDSCKERLERDTLRWYHLWYWWHRRIRTPRPRRQSWALPRTCRQLHRHWQCGTAYNSKPKNRTPQRRNPGRERVRKRPNQPP